MKPVTAYIALIIPFTVMGLLLMVVIDYFASQEHNIKLDESLGLSGNSTTNQSEMDPAHKWSQNDKYCFRYFKIKYENGTYVILPVPKCLV